MQLSACGGSLLRRVTSFAFSNVIRSSSQRSLSISNDGQYQSDILIVGGGIMGLSTAFWVKRSSPSISVTVIEKDPQYAVCSTPRSVGGIRSHFSLPENIKLSLFSWDFLVQVNEYLNVNPEDIVDISLVRKGYLFLATQKGLPVLLDNHEVQKSCGASNQLLTPEQLKDKWPCLNVDDIAMGSHGVDKEGHFDPYRLLMAFRHKAQSLGVNYVHGTVTDFSCSSSKVDSVIVDLAKNHSRVRYSASSIVIAGGAECGSLSSKLNAQNKLSLVCPVNRRKRYVYAFKCDSLNGREFPMLIDPSSMYCRGEGDNFIAGLSPAEADEPETGDLEVDYDFFDQQIWPRLAERCKNFESVKVQSGWAGYYDFNELDENAIIGSDPIWSNLYWVTGFSGHGIQMGPAVGKCVSELVLDGQYQTVDCSRLSIERVIKKEKLLETNII